jgi:hypothetical protein
MQFNKATAPNTEWALSFQCESRGLRVGELCRYAEQG